MRVLAALLLASLVFADTETATFFLTRAENAINAGKLADAEEFIERSLAEEKGFLPALVMRARLAQHRGKDADAIRELEKVLARKSDARGAVEGRAIRDAEALMAKLDVARGEFDKLLGTYVDQLLALAHNSAKRKPRLATACYQQVLAVQPKNAEAREKLKSGGKPAAKAGPKLRGKSLLNGKNLDGWAGLAPAWTVKDRILRARLDSVAQINRYKDTVEGNFEYICELRFIEPMGKDPLIGLLFGGRGEYDHFGLWVFEDSLRLERQTEKGVRSEYQRKAVANLTKGFTRNDWHTYRIVCKSKRITAYVDDKEIFSSAAADRKPNGFLALWAQDALIEIRRVALVR